MTDSPYSISLRISRTILIFCAAILLSFGDTAADEIILKNGEKVTGIIAKEMDDVILINVDIGAITLDRENISVINKEADKKNDALQKEWDKKKQKAEDRRERAKETHFNDKKSYIATDEGFKNYSPVTINTSVELKRDIATDDGKYRYSIILPADYKNRDKCPTLFVFDPGGDGFSAAWRYEYAARKKGWIVVGSHDSKNNMSSSEYRDIQDALLKDVIKNFKVNRRKLYAAGFSASSQVAHMMAIRYFEKFKGVIVTGAGVYSLKKLGNYRPKDTIKVYYMCGRKDERLSIVRRAVKKLRQAGVKTKLHIYKGDLIWPPEGVRKEAINWMVRYT